MPRTPCLSFPELCEASWMSGELRSQVLGPLGAWIRQEYRFGESKDLPRVTDDYDPSLGGVFTHGWPVGCWTVLGASPTVVLKIEHASGCRGDAWWQRISGFRCRTFLFLTGHWVGTKVHVSGPNTAGHC